MKKQIVKMLIAGLVIGSATLKVAGHYQDERLRSHETAQCSEFSQIEKPAPGFTFRRYKQEDEALFHRLREMCEVSVQSRIR